MELTLLVDDDGCNREVTIKCDPEAAERIKAQPWALRKTARYVDKLGLTTLYTKEPLRGVGISIATFVMRHVGSNERGFVRPRNGDFRDVRKANIAASIKESKPRRKFVVVKAERESPVTSGFLQPVCEPLRCTDWSHFREQPWEYEPSQNETPSSKTSTAIQARVEVPKRSKEELRQFSPEALEVLTQPDENEQGPDAVELERKKRLQRKYGPYNGGGFRDLEFALVALQCRHLGQEERLAKAAILAGMTVKLETGEQ